MIIETNDFILVGTAHVARQSVKEIKSAIEKYKPEVVAIELDYTRLMKDNEKVWKAFTK